MSVFSIHVSIQSVAYTIRAGNLFCGRMGPASAIMKGNHVIGLYRENAIVKVGLYFRRRQAPHMPPHEAPVRRISWRVPIGVSMRKRRSKKYKRTRV